MNAGNEITATMLEPLLIANEAFEYDCASRANYRYTPKYILWEAEEARILRRERHQILKKFFPEDQLDHEVVALCLCENDVHGKCDDIDCRNFKNDCICPAQCGSLCLNNPFATNTFEGYRHGALELRYVKGKGWGVFAKIFIADFKWLAPYLGTKRYPREGDRFEDTAYVMEIAGTKIMIDAKESGNFTRLINHDIKDANVKAATYRYKNQLVAILYTIKPIPAGQELLLNYEYNEDQEGVINQPWIIKSYYDAHDAGVDVSKYTRRFDIEPGTSSNQGAASVRALGNEDTDSEFNSSEDPDQRTAGKKKKAIGIFSCFKCLKCREGTKKAKTGKKGKKGKKDNRDSEEAFPLLERPAKKAARRRRENAPRKSSSPRPSTSTEQNSPRQTRSMKKGK